MPDVSGFEVCRALKGEAATAHIPIIFLTSKTEAEAQVEGFDAGAADYVAKPINAKVLKARVRLHLALIDRRQELESLVQERNPQLGADIIGEHDDPLLKLARQLALTHHEHWDGTGYPQGLKGEAIPWAGRVMAVVDAFESMTTTQFYRDPRSPQEAAREIVQ